MQEIQIIPLNNFTREFFIQKLNKTADLMGWKKLSEDNDSILFVSQSTGIEMFASGIHIEFTYLNSSAAIISAKPKNLLRIADNSFISNEILLFVKNFYKD
jgi:hypothetical protein